MTTAMLETTVTTENLTDAEFITNFEDCTLPSTAFHHRDHVRLAWLYLQGHSPLEALARFANGLRRFATANGAAGLYHETITWAFLLIIRERMERTADGGDWEDFARTNPDLLSWKPSVLDRYYRPETLGSELARKVFVMPDWRAGSV
ncbi:MAG TPA: hypothetical protein VLV54_18050 [Thermoanaerobaculia bacterium]|nr:hypothetical protein [Thermoanaerobaculia bacterium]